MKNLNAGVARKGLACNFLYKISFFIIFVKKFLRAFILTAIVAAIAMFVCLPATFAMGKVTIMVKNPDPYLGNHSRFIYEKKPGTALEDVALLKNIGDEPVNVRLYAVDAMANEHGSFLLTFPEEEQKGIGKWTEIKQKLITINPGESEDVPFRIIVPQEASPGEYLGGLVAEEADAPKTEIEDALEASGQRDKSTSCGVDETSCSQTIAVKSRIGARIYLTVPGEVAEDVKVVDFSTAKTLTGTTIFNVSVENNGNVAYEPKVTIEVYDQKGRLYEKITGSLGSSLPETRVTGSLKMKNRPLLGQFTAKAYIQFVRKFNSSQMHGVPLSEVKTLHFWVLPWELLTLAGLVVMLFMSLHLHQQKAYKSFITNSEDYVVQTGENLLLLAVKYGISWKRLAKYNSMKPPYVLSVGQKIRVPKLTHS